MVTWQVLLGAGKARGRERLVVEIGGFTSQTAARFGKLRTIDGHNRLHCSFWLYRRFARVKVDVELWSIRSVECCFERVYSPSPSREAWMFLRKTRVKVPDVFAEWTCVDAHYIIRTASDSSFIFQFILIGIYELKVGCSSSKIRTARWPAWAWYYRSLSQGQTQFLYSFEDLWFGLRDSFATLINWSS